MNVVDYFQSYENYFWIWEEDAEVISITGGSTIAYKQQIGIILNQMSVNGLPPFGSLLLTMVATNQTIDDGIDYIRSLLKPYTTKNELNIVLSADTLDEAMAFLKNLSALPPHYKLGPRRIAILLTIFKDCHNRVNASTSSGLAQFLMHKSAGKKRFLVKKAINSNILYKDFRVLSLLNDYYPTVQSIIDDLVDLPDIDEHELPPLEVNTSSEIEYKDFAEALIQNANTFQVGSLIKPIWAGFKIPIFNAHPSEQPIGGVSDLANKGNFDKLLISEFANDDLVFLSRLANNEALYLHREMPPVTDQLQRVLLIDVSLRMWGTPKILAFATWLAIHNHPKSQSTCDAYVVGDQYAPITCNTVHEVIDGLQMVDVSLHAAKGIAQFVHDHRQNKQLEIFYLTTEESRKRPEILALLSEHKSIFKYLITSEQDGHIHFYQHKNNALKQLQSIHLPLEKLWTKKEVPAVKMPSPNRPANNNVLLLIPTPIDIKATFTIDNITYCVGKRILIKRGVVNNQKTNKGWEIILTNIVASGHFEMGKTTNGEILFLAFNTENREISIHNLTTLQELHTSFPEWKSDQHREFVFYQDRFVKVVRGRIYEIVCKENHIDIYKLENHIPIYEIYKNREQESNRYAKPPSYINIFKNIMSIYINSAEALVFNTHQLTKNEMDKCILSNDAAAHPKLKEAVYNKSEGRFVFHEGSSISINPHGFITMYSSNELIPAISFTSILEYPLGMATVNHFAGDEFYYHENLSNVGVQLNKTGPHKLEVVKALRTYTNMSLKDAKHMIDNPPVAIANCIHYQKASQLIDALEGLGCEARVISEQSIQQEIISPVQFYDQYIHNFIKEIIQS